MTTLLGLVEAGLGVAAVPSLAMPGKDHPTLVSIPLVEPIVTRQMGLIKRRGRSLSPAAQQLYDLLVETRSTRVRRSARPAQRPAAVQAAAAALSAAPLRWRRRRRDAGCGA